MSMTIEVKHDMSFEDLKNNCWSGAISTLEAIEKAGLEDALMDYLDDIYYNDNTPTMTEVNDLLWFDEYINNDFINEHLTLDDIDSLEELKEYSDNYNVDMTINNTIENKRDKELWKYLQDNLYGESLKDIFETLEDLTEDIYLPAEYAKSLEELVKFANETNNDTVLDVIAEVKEIGKEKELWKRIVEEYHNKNYTLMELFVDLESLDIEEL